MRADSPYGRPAVAPPKAGRAVKSRVVRAVHGRKTVARDPEDELALSARLRKTKTADQLLALYGRSCWGDDAESHRMRRSVLRALCRRFGHGITVGAGFGFKHAETFELGDGVFLGAQGYLQGRHDGRCVIGAHSWLGPQCYFDARDLVLGEYIGWGPGAKVLGSEHTGKPLGVPILKTDLRIKTVRVEDWADVGTNAVLLPGVTVGRGAIVGAGAVVTEDVPAFCVAAGVPAKVIRSRKEKH
ncbi:MAG: acyltransferase [Elusimicrobia bacterium]|nr:acyltransferase [Elusimicrobiota bacterium]